MNVSRNVPMTFQSFCHKMKSHFSEMICQFLVKTLQGRDLLFFQVYMNENFTYQHIIRWSDLEPVWPGWAIFESSWEQSSLQK